MKAKIGASEAGRRGMTGSRLAFAIGALLAGAALGATAVAQSGGEVYTVKKGDTLWDISAEKLGEATRWPEIWNQNRQIKDPHWIYPGDQIRFAGQAPSVATGAASAVETAPGPQTVRYTRAHSAGFVAKGDFDRAGKITASYNEQEILYEGLQVFIDRGADDGVRVGDWFLVFRPGEPVNHPKSKEAVGIRVIEAGHLKVVQVGAKSARARIMRSFSEIERGNRVTPFKPFPEEFTVHPAPDDVSGTVLAEQDSRIEAGREDLIYTDVGRKHGVDVGAVLRIGIQFITILCLYCPGIG
ncbi:MAG: LysM peptidoglycan-binding domain-containing protein [Myxococcota bacterium]